MLGSEPLVASHLPYPRVVVAQPTSLIWSDPSHLSDLRFSFLPSPVAYCCLTNECKRDGEKSLLQFLLILCIRKSAEPGGDGLPCCLSCLLGPECLDGLFTPMALPSEDALQAWGLAAMAAGTISLRPWFSLEIGGLHIAAPTA